MEYKAVLWQHTLTFSLTATRRSFTRLMFFSSSWNIDCFPGCFVGFLAHWKLVKNIGVARFTLKSIHALSFSQLRRLMVIDNRSSSGWVPGLELRNGLGIFHSQVTSWSKFMPKNKSHPFSSEAQRNFKKWGTSIHQLQFFYQKNL